MNNTRRGESHSPNNTESHSPNNIESHSPNNIESKLCGNQGECNSPQPIPQGYKQSPLGIIPQEWEVKRLGEISIIDSKTLSSQTSFDYTFDYISLSDVDSEAFEITTSKQIFASAPSRARKVVSKGDILISTVRPNLKGFTKISRNVENLIASTGFAVLTPSKCNGDYLFLYFFSEMIDKQFFELVVGSNYPAVNSSDVYSLKIALPPLPEQEKIAKVLNVWDEAIERQAKLTALLEKRKQALMQRLLRGKERLKGFSGKWETVRLGDVSKIKKGVQVNKITLDKTGDYPVINGGIEPSGYSDLFNTEANTITISEGGNSCGYINFITSKFWCGGHCYSIFENPAINKMFLFQALKFNEQEIMNLRVGSGLPNIQVKAMSDYKLHIPPLPEQTAIAEVLSTADSEITLARKKLESIRTQKKGLMQQLLIGKKRVNP